MRLIRYVLVLSAGFCLGIVAATGIVNGVALLALIFLAAAVATSRTVRVWFGLADDAEPSDDSGCDCPGCPVDHSI
ncbi:hypothetical protein [Microbacterium karelineae]|uniref:hypothetical protein n=1 Tax=Microbacterium karelineae TaxID=2654283 RepID=UPI0012E9A0B1|nr:hypothetical protein [Microbacterium karelineae]